MSDFKKVIITPDGRQFNTEAEAKEHLRAPKIIEAMKVVCGGNADLANWLVSNEDVVLNAFDTGTIKRVTKAEKRALDACVDAVVVAYNDGLGNIDLAFLAKAPDAIKESFRWPAVKRMDATEKALAARNSLIAASGGNEELSDWIIATKDAILMAYKAGIVKREVTPQAAEGLEAYRLMKAEQTAQLKEAELVSPEAVAELKAKFAAAKEAAKAEKEAAKVAAKAAKDAAKVAAENVA
jgi:hypothetical protein